MIVFLIFWVLTILFSIVAKTVPTENEGSLSSTSSPTIIACCLFENSHSDRWEVICQCSFDLYSPAIVMLNIFSCSSWPSIHLLCKNFYTDPLHTFLISCLFVWCWIVSVLCMFWILTPNQIYHLQRSFPYIKWPFCFSDSFLCCENTF